MAQTQVSTVSTAEKEILRQQGIQTPGRVQMTFPGGVTLERVQEGWLIGDGEGSVVVPQQLGGEIGRAMLEDTFGGQGDSS
jgi:hypothetical protein